MAKLVLENIAKRYGRTEVIKGVDLTIDDGAFCVFVGPSGCGKSTLLRMVAGLEDISGGDVWIDETRVNDIGPADRGLAMVFQTYALYPHKTVRDNLGFALRHAGIARDAIKAKVDEAGRILGLTELMERYPKQLSGGQRQRVAIGRAIVRDPRIFLFDEPLSNLDAALRVQMRVEILRLHQRLKTTMIYVTHDQVEAMTLADQIVVLNGGVIEQAGSPMELYHHPTSLFVARFIGSPTMNVLDAEIAGFEGDSAQVRTADGTVLEMALAAAPTERGGSFGVRPEHLQLVPADIDEPGVFRGHAQVLERLGGETLVHLALGNGDMIVVKADGECLTRPGEAVAVRANLDRAHFFDATGNCIDKPYRHALTDLHPVAAQA